MTPVHQTIFGEKVGNCLQAALASLCLWMPSHEYGCPVDRLMKGEQR